MADHRVLVPTSDRERATWVIGLPGSGKSRALETWLLQDIQKGRGCGFLDPAADTFNRIVTRLAEQQTKDSDLDKRLIIIDPTNPKWTIGFNPLEPVPGVYPERIGRFMTDVILKIWKMEPGDAPRTVRLLTATFTALVELGRSLLDLPRFLGDKAWRETLMGKITSPMANEYFLFEFPKSDKEAAQWIAPTLTRLGAFLEDPDIKMMLFAKSTISFRQIMDEQKILLVNLSKGQLSEGASWLLGAFIVAQIQKAAMARADVDPKMRPPFYLYLDEFQNYTTANIQDILAESRKYGLSLILAHQFIDQLQGELRSAVTSISGTVVSFLASESDAPFLARVLFPPNSLNTSFYGWENGKFGAIKNAPTPAEVEAQLTRLHPQEFWMRQRGDNPPIKQRTFTITDPKMTPELAAARERLIDSVMTRCGRLKTEVAAEMKARQRSYGGPDKAEFTFYEDKPT